ncbi:MAG: hypothetical protein IJ033_02245 [Clostridia bacterium]|nr:hypothetical protein [Clostridia bacterium]
MGIAKVKTYQTIAWRDDEIRRYAGIKQTSAEIDALIAECKQEGEKLLDYSLCYQEFPIAIVGDDVDLSFAKVTSRDLAKNLKGANRVIVFACTVGIAFDRLIAKYNSVAPAKGLVMHAVGVERVESLADRFNAELKERLKLKPRFSPGYGDLDISLQKDIIEVLSATKNIGVTLNENMMLSPSKSVTAIIGVTEERCEDKVSGCSSCNQRECQFRR